MLVGGETWVIPLKTGILNNVSQKKKHERISLYIFLTIKAS